MNENTITELLESTGPERVWTVSDDAVIQPGAGPCIWHGLSISQWSTDA